MQKLKEIKTTEVGKIPDDWKLIHLNEIVDINPETIDKKYSFEDIKYIDIGSVENYQIKKYEHFKLSERPSRAQRIVRKNDIIVSTVRPYLHGFAKIVDSLHSLICSTGFAVLRPKDLRTVDFIFNFIKSQYFESQLNTHMTGLAYPAVTSKIVGNTILGYPKNKNEIEKIGNILSNVVKLIQKTDQIIEQTQRLKKGLMQRLLTKGIGHNQFKKVALSSLNISNMTQIACEWEVKTLKDIAVINPESINEKYSNTEINYIEIGAIRNYEIQEYVVHNLSKRPSRAQRVVRKGDIIVSTVRPYLRGFTLINDSRPNLICSTGFAVIRPKNKQDENFIFNYIKSKLFEDNIFRSMEGMAYPAITSSDVANSIIPYPKDKKEMIKIGSLLYNIDSSIKLKYSYKLKLEILKKGLMQQLLTGKIRVKV